MLAGVALYAALLAPPDSRGDLRRAALATLGYVANWNQILGGQGYFAQLAAPSPLLHTWSLAIEEQFYLLWPLLLLGLLRLGARSRRGRSSASRPLRPLLVFTVAGAAASAVAMAVLYHAGAGINRVYYGTDTRAQDLLVGAALAVVLRSRPHPVVPDGPEAHGLTRGPARGAALGGGAGLAGVLAAVGLATGASGWLYQGGFAGVAVASAVLVGAVTLAPASAWARLFSLRPVRYVGRISYGLYLYHWPLYLVVDHARTGLGGSALLGLRLGASLVVSAASFHLVETPIRNGALARRRAWIGLPAAAGGLGAALVLTTAVPAGAALGAPTAGSLYSPLPNTSVEVGGRPSTPDPPPDSPTGGAANILPGTNSLLPAVPAGAGGPIRVLLVGDSSATAMALGFTPTQPYGVDMQLDGAIGCGLMGSGLVTNRGVVSTEAAGVRGDGWVRCDTWPQRWTADVQTFHPDVAVLMDGAWEVRDRYVGERWVHIGQPGFDAQELTTLEHAVQVLGSTGAHVVLLTAPYDSQPEQADGTPEAADQPRRMDTYNALLRQAAAAFPGSASVLDFASWLQPGGRFALEIDGQQVRDSDGIHLTTAGARFVEPRLMAAWAAVGTAVRRE
ncbi:MAG TPA: acyltransferase family protein, partial [Acidimicrobiales bacterium]|nr:acyltransferase family protein [Acidimicrobiales bacterium]